MDWFMLKKILFFPWLFKAWRQPIHRLALIHKLTQKHSLLSEKKSLEDKTLTYDI